jgi:hypothetical protein
MVASKRGAQSVTVSAEELEARIGEMERKLERLRALYESFFLGIERAPPNVPRREMNRLILEMQQEPIGNASLRFRFQAIMQRWVLFTAYWNRTLREIEAGTFRRDLARAQRHLAEKGGAITEQEAINLGIPAGRARAFADRQQRMAASRASKAAKATGTAEAAKAAGAGEAPKVAAPVASGSVPQRAVPIPGVTDADVAGVYRRYLESHGRVSDGRPPLTLEKIRERLAAQIPKVLAERNCRRVTLDVAIENGKVRLKAWPVVE